MCAVPLPRLVERATVGDVAGRHPHAAARGPCEPRVGVGLVAVTEPGNGVLEPPFEQCDDGNTVGNDGCSPFCLIETICGALNTVTTRQPGCFAAGASTGPADLEDSISMAGAAVMKAAGFLRKHALALSESA